MATKPNDFWSAFGKISAVIGTLAALLTIFFSLTAKGPNLVARGYTRGFAYQPDLVDVYKRVRSTEDRSNLKEIILDVTHKNGYTNQFMVNEIASSISSKFDESWGNKYNYSLRSFDAFAVIKIRNKGAKPAENVVLDLPANDLPLQGIALITERDQGQRLVDVDKKISIGTIRPNNDVSIAIWSEVPISDYREKEFGVTHADGTSSVAFGHTLIGIKRIFGENIWFILWVLFFILLAVFFAGGWVEALTAKDKDISDGTGENLSIEKDIARDESNQAIEGTK
jgi:hypothetical protein